MEYSAILAGTGFEGRDARIRAYARPGMSVTLAREPRNPHDENAIAVYLPVRRWYTPFKAVPLQIGYIKKSRAASMAKQMDAGGQIVSATIKSMDTYDKHPRVSLSIKTDW